MSAPPPDSLVTQIAKRLAALASGRKGLALGLWGPPGVGKSHAAAQVLARLAYPSYTLHAAAAPSSWHTLLPPARSLPFWAERLLERVAKGGYAEPEALADALAAWLGALAPTVLYLEDLHEAPPELQQTWQALATQLLRGRAVGLLLTSRSPLGEPIEAQAIEPLSEAQSAQLLRAEVGAELPPEALAWIYRRASGNPLFSLEYFRYLARLGHLWSDGRRWHWRKPEQEAMPTVVEALVAHHLHTALEDGQLRPALVAKALLPRETPNETWALVAGLSPAVLERAEGELVALGILREGDFAHPLFREGLYGEVSPAERRDVARRALRVFADAPLAATGFIADAALAPQEAIAWLKKAAEASSENPNRAARLLGQAAQYASGAEQSELALVAARTLAEQDLPEATRLAELALSAQPAQAGHFEATLLLAELRAKSGQFEEALGLLRSLPEVMRNSQWQARLAQVLIAQDQYQEVLELWGQAAPKDPFLLRQVAWSLVNLGRPQEALELIAGLDAPAALANQAELLRVRGIAHFVLGELGPAAADLSAALGAFRQSGELRAVAYTLSNRANLYSLLGDFQQVVQDYQAGMETAAQIGDRYLYSRSLQGLGLALGYLGQFERAEDVLLEARERFERTAQQQDLAYAEISLGILYADWSPEFGPLKALRHARAGLMAARQAEGVFALAQMLGAAATVEARFGSASKALEWVEEAEALSTQHQLPAALGIAHLARGYTLEKQGQLQAAADSFRSAMEVAASLGARYDLERTGLELDRLTGDLDSARQRLGWFRERGLGNGIKVALRYFPQLAQDSPPVAPASTPRLEVLGSLRLDRKPLTASKLQELLAVLLEARLEGEQELSQLELFERLYPQSPEPEAKRSLQQLVYRLRQSYGPALVLKTPSGYRLGEVRSDAEEFLRSGDTRLWRGVYLEGLEPGEAVQGRLYRRLFAATEETLELDPEEALRSARILYQAEPYSLPALALLLRALRASGDAPALERVYAQARAAFAEVGEYLPERLEEFNLTL